MTPIGDDDLQAYLDRRMADDPQGDARLQAVEDYLAAHPDAARTMARDREIGDALRAALQAKFAEPLPPYLRISQIRLSHRQRVKRQLRFAAAMAVVLLAGAAAGWTARGLATPASIGAATESVANLGFTRDALAAYRTYVVEKRHAVEVDATQEQHLVTWLSKRLGRPLHAPALDAYGFHLMGGRLLPALDAEDGSGVAAAQFMYESEDGRRMTLYVRSGTEKTGVGAETAFRFQQSGDTATFAWIDRGFGFALTAPTERAKLLPIAEAIYQAYEADSAQSGSGASGG